MGFKASAEATSKQPTQSEEKIIPFYLPITKTQFPGLIDKLEATLIAANLSHIKLMTTDYWHPYQNGIRQGRIGIYLTAPHFASWLVNKHGFNPQLKLAGTLRYVLAARRADSGIFEVNDLANKTVCTSATMGIGFLLVKASMPRSVLSAKTRRVSSVLEQMGRDSRQCHAFSLSEHLFVKIASDQPYEFIRLQQSNEFSNYAYMIHPKVSQQTTTALVKLLKTKAVEQTLEPMYQLFSAEPRLIRARANHYPTSQMSPLVKYWGADQAP